MPAKGYVQSAAHKTKARYGRHFWTQEQVELLFELRDDEAWEWPEIAKHLGIDQNKCVAKYENEYSRHKTRCEKAPNKLFIDREHRAAARDRQDLTAQFFGDPPPGYSALDQRRQSR